MLEVRDIAWLAGLLEGEGCFMWRASDGPSITLNMTDRDVVARAAALLKGNVTGPYKQPKPHHKDAWKVRITGPKAAAWMMTLLSFLGERRGAKVWECLTNWKNYKPKPRPNRFAGTPYKRERGIPTCHPDRRVVGFGLCGMCYMRLWRASRDAEFEAASASAIA